MIAAILRAQLLSLWPRKGARRAGASFSLATGLIYYGFWAAIAAAAMFVFSNPPGAAGMVPMLSFALLIAGVYWQLLPLFTMSFGASLDLTKLRAYPIPAGDLFFIELLLRFTNSAELLLVMAGVSAGLVSNPRYGLRSAPAVVAGALLFIALNILIAGGLRLAMERWFRISRWKEAGFLLFLAMVIAPQFLIRARFNVIRFAPAQVFWPWAAAARIMAGERVTVSAGILAAWIALAFWFNRAQFARSLHFDAAGHARREAEPRVSFAAAPVESVWRVLSGFLSDPIAAVVEKEIRTFVRISRVRLILVISGCMGALLYMPYLMEGRPREGVFFENALPILCLYALLGMAQVSFWNSFGFDRGATMGYFCWPVRIRDVLAGKNIAAVFLLAPQLGVVWGIAAVMGLPASPAKFVEAVAVTITSALYWFGLGNIASVRLARPMDPDRMGQMSGKMQALTIWAAPVLLVPVVLAYFARHVFDSDLVFSAVMCVAALVGCIFYFVALDSAVTTVRERRETFLADLSRADGPVSIT